MDTTTGIADGLDQEIAALKAKAADYGAQHKVIDNVTWPNGRHELFVVGTDANHGVWHSWQASASVCGGQLLDAVKATGAAYADTASPRLWATLDTQSPSTGRHSCAL